MTRKELLNTAETIVCTDREGQYGKPENNFGIIADLWSAYLERDISPIDVACMMTLLKIARIKTGKHFKADSWVDAIGYLACGGEIDAKLEGATKDVDVEKVGGPHD